MKKLKAFTLSEVMITVGIIGVIAALTIPGLMNGWQKETETTQIRKFATDLSNSIDSLISEEGKTKFSATSLAKKNTGVNDFITSHFKVTKSCAANGSGCFASEDYISIDGTESGAFKCSETSYVLANSAAICITRSFIQVRVAYNKPSKFMRFFMPEAYAIDPIELPALQDGQIVTKKYLAVQVDTNGTEGPNIGGRDMFLFYVGTDGEITGVKPESDSELEIAQEISQEGDPVTQEKEDCTDNFKGKGCFTRLMSDNWKMNY